MKTINTDIIIIGAGPSGLFTVFEAGFLGYNCVVVDSLPEIGGQLSALYPEKPIYDIPGYPEILAGELVEKLKEQAAPFNPQYLMNNPVTALEDNGEDGFKITTPEAEITAKVVILAGGLGVFTPRKPPLENLETFEEKSVFYAVRGKDKFADKTLVIAGGGDSAVDWAVELAKTAKHIHVVHRRNDFRAHEETVRQMHELADAGKITLHTPCQLGGVDGQNGELSRVIIKDLNKEETTIDADCLLCFFGIAPTLGPIAEWGIGVDKKKVAVDAATMQTSRKGILGVGDIVEYPGKLGLILTGFAEAAIAAKTAQSVINPEKKYRLVYSTSVGSPGTKAS